MIYIILAVTGLAALYFCIRYILLKRAVKEITAELHEITGELEQNRIVKLPSPQQELEGLLKEVNQNLYEVRKTKISYEDKEIRLQKQIENISHDLRTPVTSILGFLELIDEGSLCDDDKESLDVIKRKARALKKLVTEFYDLSRMSAGDYALEPKALDIGRVLRETAIVSYQELQLKKLEVRLEIPDTEILVLADENALMRIFSNLLQNAGRYADSRLNIILSEDADKVTILLENDSESIRQEEIQSLFERFYTADGSRTEGSTGLGLPIARYLAENMGGELTAKTISKEEKNWLQFYLQLKRI